MLSRRCNVSSSAPTVLPVAARWDDLDRLFRELSSDFPFMTARLPVANGQSRAWFPPLNIHEADGKLVVEAEIPGVDPKEIEITVEGNVLTLSGEKKEESQQKEKNYHYTERRFGSFQRSVELPVEVDPDNVTAEYTGGILKVTLARTGAEKPRKISVNVK